MNFAIVFIGLPTLLFVLGDFAPRTFLKDAISYLTIIAFSLILSQFFLSKTKHLTYHKIIGYFVVIVFLLHPFLIILPRYFEAGANPIDSFFKMITTFESNGVILGLIAWVLMLLIGLTSMFRAKLNISYNTWRVFHTLLSLSFIFIATVHSVDLGRHTNRSISIFFILLAIFGASMVIKKYLFLKKEPLNVK